MLFRSGGAGQRVQAVAEVLQDQAASEVDSRECRLLLSQRSRGPAVAMVENDRTSAGVQEAGPSSEGAGHGSRQICLTCRRGEEAEAR